MFAVEERIPSPAGSILLRLRVDVRPSPPSKLLTNGGLLMAAPPDGGISPTR